MVTKEKNGVILLRAFIKSLTPIQRVQVYEVMSALRGPDNLYLDVKRYTSMVARNRLGFRANEHTGDVARPRDLTNSKRHEIMCRLKNSSHFQRHWRLAERQLLNAKLLKKDQSIYKDAKK